MGMTLAGILIALVGSVLVLTCTARSFFGTCYQYGFEWPGALLAVGGAVVFFLGITLWATGGRRPLMPSWPRPPT